MRHPNVHPAVQAVANYGMSAGQGAGRSERPGKLEPGPRNVLRKLGKEYRSVSSEDFLLPSRQRFRFDSEDEILATLLDFKDETVDAA